MKGSLTGTSGGVGPLSLNLYSSAHIAYGGRGCATRLHLFFPLYTTARVMLCSLGHALAMNGDITLSCPSSLGALSCDNDGLPIAQL